MCSRLFKLAQEPGVLTNRDCGGFGCSVIRKYEYQKKKKKSLKGREQTENLPFEEGASEDLEEEQEDLGNYEEYDLSCKSLYYKLKDLKKKV